MTQVMLRHQKKALMNKSIMKSFVGQHKGRADLCHSLLHVQDTGYGRGWHCPGSVIWNRPLEQAPGPAQPTQARLMLVFPKHNMVSERD